MPLDDARSTPQNRALVTNGNGLVATASGFRLRSAAALRSDSVPAVSPSALHFSRSPTADRSLELNNNQGKYKTRRFSSHRLLAKRRGRETRDPFASCQPNEYWEFRPM